MKNIVIGKEYEVKTKVTEQMLALNVGSGNVSVYATPMMVALMENAAANCMTEFLDEGETTVGTSISTSHIAATPLAMEVKAIAKIVAVDGKKINFEIEAYDERELIGKATHTRFVLNKEKFEQKAHNK